MNVFELIRNRHSNQDDSGSLENAATNSTNTSSRNHETEESNSSEVSISLSTEERKALQDQWHDLPLIQLLPVNRRREAQEILDRTPKLISVLEMCKRGTHDAFTAMQLLGMNPFGNFPGLVDSCCDCIHVHTSMVPAGNYCRRGDEPVKLELLDGCEHHEKR